MGGYNSLEGLLARGIWNAIGANLTLRRGRYGYVLDGPDETRQGRAHVFLGSGQLVVADPASSEALTWPVPAIKEATLERRRFRHEELVVELEPDTLLTLRDAGRGNVDRAHRALQQAVDGLTPLPALSTFAVLLAFERQDAAKRARREEAAAEGRMLDDEAEKALREPVEAQGLCGYLGEAHAPGFEPKGPGFYGWVLAGTTRFCFVAGGDPPRPWMSHAYEDISLLAYRDEEAVAPNWVVEFLSEPSDGPFSKGGMRFCVRLPAPGIVEPNVTDAILTRVRERSRFDLTGCYGAESEVDGLVLLPITKWPEGASGSES